MTIDVSPKKTLLSKEELAAKFEKDKENVVQWAPAFSRIKIERDKESISGLIAIPDKDGSVWVRGTILACGPMVGLHEGVRYHQFKPGQRILYNKSHEQTYRDAAGVEHVFLRDNSDIQSILAIEDINNEAVK